MRQMQGEMRRGKKDLAFDIGQIYFGTGVNSGEKMRAQEGRQRNTRGFFTRASR
jgi:hypothetical protein